MSRARVAFAGTPDFAVPTLEALAASPHELVGVLTQPDRPRGRGRALAQSPVKMIAQRLGLPVSQPHSLRTPEDRSALQTWRPDVLVVVAYGLILPPDALSLPPRGCINVHASLLPRWRGAAPVQRAILNGDTETGVTIMQMDAGLDTGPMLLQRRTPISAAETAGSIFDRLARLGADALLEALPSVIASTAHPQAQPASGATYARKLEKSDAPVDWQASAAEVSRRIRGLDPWPIAEASWNGETLKLRGADIVDESSSGEPGRVRGLLDGALVVECGRGAVGVREWQRPGRRWLAATEFANGLPVVGGVLTVAAGR